MLYYACRLTVQLINRQTDCPSIHRRGFKPLSWKYMEGMAWNLACQCILTKFRTSIWLHSWFSNFRSYIYSNFRWNRSSLVVLGRIRRMHGRNSLKFGMLLYPGHRNGPNLVFLGITCRMHGTKTPMLCTAQLPGPVLKAFGRAQFSRYWLILLEYSTFSARMLRDRLKWSQSKCKWLKSFFPYHLCNKNETWLFIQAISTYQSSFYVK